MNINRPFNDDDRRLLAARLQTRPHTRWTVVAGLVAMMLYPAAALARDDLDAADPGDGAYCSATARLLNTACGFEAKDDFCLSKAKCINLGDGHQRASCLTEAARARSEAGKVCSAQLQARRALCTVFGEGRYDPPFTPDLFDSDFRKLSNPNPYFPLGIGTVGSSVAVRKPQRLRSWTRPS